MCNFPKFFAEQAGVQNLSLNQWLLLLNFPLGKQLTGSAQWRTYLMLVRVTVECCIQLESHTHALAACSYALLTD